MREEWMDILLSSFHGVAQRLAGVAPRLLAAFTLLVAGWIVAAILRRVALRVCRALDVDRRSARWGVSPGLYRAGLRRSPAELIARSVFWVVFAIGLLMGIEALELPAAVGLAPAVIRFLPNLIVALLVLLFGWLVANILAQAVLILIVNAQLSGGPLVSGVLRWLVLLFAASVALTQLGIAREMVLLAFGIAFGGAVFALALAFGLGGRDLAREALERWLVRRHEREPDHMTHV
jgi:hypothetical protein